MRNIYKALLIATFAFGSFIANATEATISIDGKTEGSKIYSFENAVYVKTAALEGTITVYDLLGNVVAKDVISSELTSVALDVAPGYYIVVVEAGEASTSEKVYIK